MTLETTCTGMSSISTSSALRGGYASDILINFINSLLPIIFWLASKAENVQKQVIFHRLAVCKLIVE